jgi:hypothetical protein
MKILQVEGKLDSQEIDFNSIYTKSGNVLPLNKSGAAALSQIIRDFIVGLKEQEI